MKKITKKNNNWEYHRQNFLLYIWQMLENLGKLLKITLDLRAIVLFALTFGVMIYAQTQNGQTRLILEIFGLITTSLLSGIIAQNWIELQGNSYIIKKSDSAIRNLRLIKIKIKNVSERINELRSKDNQRDNDEINNLVNNVEKDILNSILDWADVNPNSGRVVDYFETIRVREEKVITLENEKKQLEERMSKLDKDKAQLSSRLQNKIDEMDKQISELNAQISDQSLKGINIASGTISGFGSNTTLSGVMGDTGTSNYFIINKCSNCGKPLSLSEQYSTTQLCDKCSKLMISGA